MGFRVRQVRQLLGLATATALCALLAGAQAGSAPNNLVLQPASPEFRVARLAYNDNTAFGFGRGRFGGGSWTTDAPEAEFHLTQGIRRLTRINTIDPETGDIRNVVLPIQPLDDELLDYPFLYAVEVGRWYLNDEEAAKLPDYHEVFHVVWDLDHRVQIPGIVALMSGRTYEQDGVDPHWRGIFDDHGRLMVAINFDMDLGDAWEHADTPEYPQEDTALAYRFGISYAIYAMSH